MKRAANKITFVTYRDSGQHGRQGCEVKEIESEDKLLMVKPQIVPGLFGYPDMHVNVLVVDGIRIFTHTDYPLTDTKKAEIEREAIKLLQEHRTRN